MTRTQKLIHNTLILTATSIIIGVVGIYFNMFLSKKSGAETMGVFSLLMSVYFFAMTLAVSGVNLAVTRLVAEEMTLGREKNVVSAMRSCLAYATFFGVLSAVLLAVSAPFIGTCFLRSPQTVLPLRVLACALPFVAISTVLTGYFTAMQQGIRTSSAQILEQFVRFFICAQLLTLFGMNVYMAIVLGGVLSEVFGCVYRFILWKRPRSSKGDNLTGRMFKIALPVAFSSYLKQALSTAKQVLVPINLERGGISSSNALAHYGIIQGMALPLLLFPACLLNSFSTMLVPEIAHLHVHEYRNRIKGAISRIFKVTLIFSIGVCAMFFCYARSFAMLLYNNPSAAVYIRILALSVPIIYFDNIVDGLLKGLDKQVSVVRINIIDSLATIAMIITILPKWGLAGYIVVFFASELLNAFLSIYRLLKTVACRFDLLGWVAKPLISACVTIAIMQFVALPFILDVCIFVACYFIGLLFLRAVVHEDFRL